MTTTIENSRRIAKNTLMLYFRMFLIMAVGLYTSRIILQALGVMDFGIYNVVGGVVTMFGFINSSLSGASSRFITFALGRGDVNELQKEFSSIVVIHYLIAVGILILAETVGLWFVLHKLVIPENRMHAAFWVYQSAVVSSVIMLISTPYNALIIAHEHMGAFAYISILETFSRLGIVFLLFVITYDKLIVYAVLIVLVQIIIRMVYTLYCRRHFPESKGNLVLDRKRAREIFSYAGWVLNGNLAVVGYTQGLNILLNLFFGPAVNAARGIAVQVQAACNQFFASFQTAVNPQITKSYAQNDLRYMHQLIISSSRFSFYLMLLISLPILFQTEYILHLWLGQVPDYTINFVRIMLLVALNYTLSGPTLIAIHATGKIKRFQIIEGSLLLSVVPICYILLKYVHISPYMVFVTYGIIEFITQFVRVSIAYPQINLPVKFYFTKVLWPIIKVCSIIWILPLSLFYYYGKGLLGGGFFCLMTLLCIISVIVSVWLLGTDKIEHKIICNRWKTIYRRVRL